MLELMWRQVHGAKDLAQDAVEATVNAVAEIQQDITRVPYAVLKRIPGIGAHVHGIEHVQQVITTGIYSGILAGNELPARANPRAPSAAERSR